MPHIEDIKKLFQAPLAEAVSKARAVHEKSFPQGSLQAARLCSIKTGGCPEDCAYCAQSAHYQTGLKKEALLPLKEVVERARRAKEEGAGRFCMGAAWREVKDGPAFERVLRMVEEASALGLEVCCSLGMLTYSQALRLKAAGLYAYNHNLDSSRAFYSRIITTRSYDQRLQTLKAARKAGLTLCAGGILGMGESEEDRWGLIHELTKIQPHPESVTINLLVPMKGTPLQNAEPVSPLDVARVIAAARIFMPKSVIRLSAGRNRLTWAEQFLCFYSGANSVFLGERLLTAENPPLKKDLAMLKAAGLPLQRRLS